ncbi:MAG TPA: hypothetical protein VLE73_06215 [Candidatus Saccharimonadales bacterium]|nr:hypothetical protein [Candidatus Saccharimonadales bacterium]
MELLLVPTEFEHDPKPADMPGQVWEALHMQAAEVRRYEMPLLQDLKQTYAQRFPRVCGPASIALAHLLSHSFNMPITNEWNIDAAPPHLRLLPSWFNPSEDPSWGEPTEHTLLEDDTGTGYSLTIDPTIRLQHGAALAPGVIRIEWHRSPEVESDMTYMANMHKPRSSRTWKPLKFFPDESSPEDGYRDINKLMHSPAVFDDIAMTQGNIYEVGEYWGPPLRGVIDRVLQTCS